MEVFSNGWSPERTTLNKEGFRDTFEIRCRHEHLVEVTRVQQAVRDQIASGAPLRLAEPSWHSGGWQQDPEFPPLHVAIVQPQRDLSVEGLAVVFEFRDDEVAAAAAGLASALHSHIASVPWLAKSVAVLLVNKTRPEHGGALEVGRFFQVHWLVVKSVVSLLLCQYPCF